MIGSIGTRRSPVWFTSKLKLSLIFVSMDTVELQARLAEKDCIERDNKEKNRAKMHDLRYRGVAYCKAYFPCPR